MKTKNILLDPFKIFLLLLITVSVNAQSSLDWAKTYNGTGNRDDEAKDIAVDAEGNVYVTGSSVGHLGKNNYSTIKYSPTGIQQWVQRYNGTGPAGDAATSIAVDGIGNVYVTGTSSGLGTEFDCVTIKYNAFGSQQWLQRFDMPVNLSDESGVGVVLDKSGNIFVGGNYDFGCFLIKYNSSGVQQWVKEHEVYDGEFITSMALDSSGNVYLGGEADIDNNHYGGLHLLIKYNSFGILLWNRIYGEGYFEGVKSVGVDVSGNVYTTGKISSDYGTIKYDSSGSLQWVQKYNGTANGSDFATSLAIDPIGNIYVTGSCGNWYGQWQGNSSYDYVTIKYSPSGFRTWVRIYDTPDHVDDYASSISVDNSANVYVTGVNFEGSVRDDYTTIKYDSSGVQQWIQIYNLPVFDPPNSGILPSVTADNFGNVYVCGANPLSDLTFDYLTIKYKSVSPAAGIPILLTPVNGTANMPLSFQLDWGNVSLPSVTYDVQVSKTVTFTATVFNRTGLLNSHCLIPVSGNNLILKPYTQYYWRARSHSTAGISEWSTVWTFTTGAESEEQGVKIHLADIPKEYKLYENYPNPFNPVTTIKFDIPNDANVEITIYDMLGKEVKVLADEFKQAGSYEVNFDASSLSSGMYFYKLTAGSFTDIKKMVLVK